MVYRKLCVYTVLPIEVNNLMFCRLLPSSLHVYRTVLCSVVSLSYVVFNVIQMFALNRRTTQDDKELGRTTQEQRKYNTRTTQEQHVNLHRCAS